VTAANGQHGQLSPELSFYHLYKSKRLSAAAARRVAAAWRAGGAAAASPQTRWRAGGSGSGSYA